MRISAASPARLTQGRLWPLPLTSAGQARTVVGRAAEELTVAFFNGVRHKTDSRCEYCPDISLPHTDPVVYIESKAVGLSNQTFIYAGRLDKDRAFAASRPLYYAIWRHGARTADYEDVPALQAAVVATLRYLYFIPFAAVDGICAGLPVIKLNSRYGGSDTNPRYGSGYRLPLGVLEPYIFAEFRNCCVLPTDTAGRQRRSTVLASGCRWPGSACLTAPL